MLGKLGLVSKKYLSPSNRTTLYKRGKGLSKFNREALKIMEKLNIVCDLFHANDALF
ncbi:hypothetical protein [Coxiella-like endosymbiont of Rhipicephalus sanguineus]|uniref:hypothetical protein n=1 Tax=Coxiella-like endosymbiont of Rhipicephalus sanguineus TaxID=1955402 RepID=UPI00203DC3B9|nr:hypothetical protein [Coxiella-like endosymbiont of Rhipicephalus sanguineus]